MRSLILAVVLRISGLSEIDGARASKLVRRRLGREVQRRNSSLFPTLRGHLVLPMSVIARTGDRAKHLHHPVPPPSSQPWPFSRSIAQTLRHPNLRRVLNISTCARRKNQGARTTGVSTNGKYYAHA